VAICTSAVAYVSSVLLQYYCTVEGFSHLRVNIEHWAQFQSDGVGLEKCRIFSEVRTGNFLGRKKEFFILSL
jgi:hypothetical protein